jgi:hypothetical protein
LDEGCEFADTSSLLAENFLCVGGADDDISDLLGVSFTSKGRGKVTCCGGYAHFNTGVALLSKFSLEELVQFRKEDAISHL